MSEATGVMTAKEPSSTTLYFGPWYRKSPFFEATLRHGCTAYDIYNHMYLPSYFHDPIEEYWHLLKHVTIWDVAVERIVEITGQDAFEFTNLLTCRDLTRCAVGQCKYAPIIDASGGIINDPVLLRLGENHFWLALADSDVLLWAKGAALNSGLTVEIKEPDVAPIQIQGPDSKPVMEALFGDGLRGLKYYYCLETKLDDIPVVVSRTGWTAEVGYEIYLRDGSRGDELWERVMTAGKPVSDHADSAVRGAGASRPGSSTTALTCDWRTTRSRSPASNGSSSWTPQPISSAGRRSNESRREGVKRKLVGIELSGDALAAELVAYWPVFHQGKRVGHVTDAIYSPRLERNIGYAWVPVSLAAAGTELEAIGACRHAARAGGKPRRSSIPRKRSRRDKAVAETTSSAIRSPFYKAHAELGATFMEEGGWLWTESFGDLDAEYRGVRDDLGVWDVSPLNKWSFRGRDALKAAGAPSHQQRGGAAGWAGSLRRVLRQRRADGRRRHGVQVLGRPRLGDDERARARRSLRRGDEGHERRHRVHRPRAATPRAPGTAVARGAVQGLQRRHLRRFVTSTSSPSR